MIKTINIKNQKHLKKILYLYKGYADQKKLKLEYSYDKENKNLNLEIKEPLK